MLGILIFSWIVSVLLVLFYYEKLRNKRIESKDKVSC